MLFEEVRSTCVHCNHEDTFTASELIRHRAQCVPLVLRLLSDAHDPVGVVFCHHRMGRHGKESKCVEHPNSKCHWADDLRRILQVAEKEQEISAVWEYIRTVFTQLAQSGGNYVCSRAIRSLLEDSNATVLRIWGEAHHCPHHPCMEVLVAVCPSIGTTTEFNQLAIAATMAAVHTQDDSVFRLLASARSRSVLQMVAGPLLNGIVQRMSTDHQHVSQVAVDLWTSAPPAAGSRSIAVVTVHSASHR